MERRDFLKLTAGFAAGAAGAAALAASAQAAPLPPVASTQGLAPPRGENVEPALTSQDDVDHLAPEPVRWRRRFFIRRPRFHFRRPHFFRRRRFRY